MGKGRTHDTDCVLQPIESEVVGWAGLQEGRSQPLPVEHKLRPPVHVNLQGAPAADGEETAGSEAARQEVPGAGALGLRDVAPCQTQVRPSVLRWVPRDLHFSEVAADDGDITWRGNREGGDIRNGVEPRGETASAALSSALSVWARGRDFPSALFSVTRSCRSGPRGRDFLSTACSVFRAFQSGPWNWTSGIRFLCWTPPVNLHLRKGTSCPRLPRSPEPVTLG